MRVIHAQVMQPADQRRIGRLGIVAEVQPYHAIDDMRWMEERIGARARAAYAFRDLMNGGAAMASVPTGPARTRPSTRSTRCSASTRR